MDYACIRLGVICILASTGIAVADPQSECSVNASNQIEIGNCLTLSERIADATVATAFDFALQSAQELDEITQRQSSVPALEASQTGWLAYRDQHCDFVGTTFGGGSGTGIAIKSCRISLTRARADDLMTYTQ
jgi:uncharacterized protein YecT (DUF1311 family)